MELFINTALSCTEIAIKDGKGQIEAKKWLFTRSECEQILDFLSSYFDAKRASYRDLGHIYALCGPGSFTGIRIGLSIVNTICFTTDAIAYPITLSQYANMRSPVTDFDYIVPCGARGLFFGHSKGKSIDYISRDELESRRKNEKILVFAGKKEDPLLSLKGAISYEDLESLKNVFGKLKKEGSAKILSPIYAKEANIS